MFLADAAFKNLRIKLNAMPVLLMEILKMKLRRAIVLTYPRKRYSIPMAAGSFMAAAVLFPMLKLNGIYGNRSKSILKENRCFSIMLSNMLQNTLT